MPSSYDSCRALAVETPAEGGTQARGDVTEVDPTQDALAAAGLHLVGSSATANDKSVWIDRTAGGLRLTDGTAQRLLSELMAVTDGSAQSHSAARGLEHYLAGGGPGPGIAPSGAYLQRIFSGPLLTSETWFTSSAASTKILSRTLTYPTGSVLCSSQAITIYNASGSALRTCTDTYSYSGPLITSCLRAWS